MDTQNVTDVFRPTQHQRVFMNMLLDRLLRGQPATDVAIAPYVGIRPEAISRWRRNADFQVWFDREVRTRCVACTASFPRLPPRNRPKPRRCWPAHVEAPPAPRLPMHFVEAARIVGGWPAMCGGRR